MCVVCSIERSIVKLRLLFLLLAVVLCVFDGGKKKKKVVAILGVLDSVLFSFDLSRVT